MSGVRLASIGSAVEAIESWTPERDSPDDTFVYIDLSAVDQEEKVISAPRKLACTDAPSRARQLVRSGDILVSTVRPNLNGVAVVPRKLDGATASTGFCVLRPQEGKLHSSYLYHWVKSPAFVSDMVRKATGASYPAVSDRIVQEAKIPLPPLPEQRKIAEILDKADVLRARRRAVIAQLDTLTQSIFLDMFGDPATNPKGWPIDGIRNVCELIVDCVNRTAPTVDEATPFKMIRTTNVKSGKVDLSKVRFVIREVFDRWNRRATPRRGDVLLTREAPVGEVGIIDSDDALFLGQRLMLYRAKRDRVTPEYLLASFQGSFLQSQFHRHGSGSTVKHLPLPACRAFEIHTPPMVLQRQFSKAVGALKEQIRKQNESSAQLGSLFIALQHRAFNGGM